MQTEYVSVYTEWQGNWAAHDFSRIRIIDPTPVFSYRQNSRTHISREPMYRVALELIDGDWEGVVSCRELRAAGYFAASRAD